MILRAKGCCPGNEVILFYFNLIYFRFLELNVSILLFNLLSVFDSIESIFTTLSIYLSINASIS